MKSLIAVILMLIAVIAWLEIPAARDNTEDPFVVAVRNAEKQLTASKAVLSEDGWGEEDLQQYLANALQLVYSAKVLANRSFDPAIISATNDDLQLLVEYGYLPYWPEDPINDWEPVALVDKDRGFVADAILIDVCPPEYESTLGTSCAFSFNIFIFAPEVNLSLPGQVIAFLGENKEWGTIPDGALYGFSYYGQSDRKRQELREQYGKSDD